MPSLPSATQGPHHESSIGLPGKKEPIGQNRSNVLQDIAMFFDKMVRAHHVDRVLGQVIIYSYDLFSPLYLLQARRLFAEYLNEDWTPSPQPNAAQAIKSLLHDSYMTHLPLQMTSTFE